MEQKNKRIEKMIIILAALVLALYLIFLTWRMFFYAYGDYYRTSQQEMQYNLIPMKTLVSFFDFSNSTSIKVRMYNLGGNIAVFIPLGFLLSIFFKRKRTYMTALLSFMIISAAELTQLLTCRGVFDVDDILLNMLGCFLGYTFYMLLTKYIHLREEKLT